MLLLSPPPLSRIDETLALLAPAMALPARVRNVVKRKDDMYCFTVLRVVHMPAGGAMRRPKLPVRKR